MTITDDDWKLIDRGDGKLVFAASTSVIDPDPEPEPEVPELSIDQELRGWTMGEAWQWADIDHDATTMDVVGDAEIIWPDGTPGVYTMLTQDASLHQWNSFKVTYGTVRTVTRTRIRNADGLVTSDRVVIS